MYKEYTLYNEGTGEIEANMSTRKVPKRPHVVGRYRKETHKIVDGQVVERVEGEKDLIRKAYASSELRIKRNATLASSDWTQVPDSPLSDQERQQWATYRQALRDLPANTPDPLNVTWPEPPTRG